MLHPDRLLPTDDHQRSIARALYESVKDLPIISPHGHTDPEWFATDAPFTDPVSLFITPDHYVFRMLYSQGIALEALVLVNLPDDEEARTVWRLFAENYHLFRGTPSRIWLDHVFSEVFDIEQRLSSDTADAYFDTISAALKTDAFKPRALFDRFNIEVLATTESPLDTLPFHDQIAASEWDGRVITTFRPDPVMDPEFEGFVDNVEQLGELTNTDISSYAGYLNALRDRRGYFRARGATATDHGHPSPRTADLSGTESAALYQKVLSGSASSEDADLFRAQMLTEMAAMSVEDGMVMQIHPGSFRNHNRVLFDRYGRDMGADIPMQTSYVAALNRCSIGLATIQNYPSFCSPWMRPLTHVNSRHSQATTPR